MDYRQQAVTQPCPDCSIIQKAHLACCGKTAAYSATSPDAVGVQPKVKQAVRKVRSFEEEQQVTEGWAIEPCSERSEHGEIHIDTLLIQFYLRGVPHLLSPDSTD